MTEPLWYKNMDFLLTFLNNYTWWCNRIFEEEGLYQCAAILRMARKACLTEPRRGQRMYFMYIIIFYQRWRLLDHCVKFAGHFSLRM